MANQQAKRDDNRVPGLLIHDSTGAETRQVRSSAANPNALPVEVVASSQESGLSTAAVISVADQATSTTLIAASTTAKERIIQNDSTSILYIKHGTTASATDYTVKLGTDDVWITQYIGRIDGIWSADASGAAKITEHS